MAVRIAVCVSLVVLLIGTTLILSHHLGKDSSTPGILTCEVRGVTVDDQRDSANVTLEGARQIMGCAPPSCRVFSILTTRKTVLRLTAVSAGGETSRMEFTVSELGDKLGRPVAYSLNKRVKATLILRWTRCRSREECLI